jgi:hypothetical protein
LLGQPEQNVSWSTDEPPALALGPEAEAIKNAHPHVIERQIYPVRNLNNAFHRVAQVDHESASLVRPDVGEELAPQLRPDRPNSGYVDRQSAELLKIAEAMSWRWVGVVESGAHRDGEEFEGSAETPSLGEGNNAFGMFVVHWEPLLLMGSKPFHYLVCSYSCSPFLPFIAGLAPACDK